ncbi:class I SAM-dependent methyltransferase [Fischerella sp. PCC 9605]|uniref:class I SAM-dependent methyltransferase n=1 Tax=Fischerella sp. PCC 9605 TaxID=1173024 RepID=UPI00047D3707|nr:class I SAM-dependent methyltransferase [Fischerella sp. PCC 9605]
MISNKEVYRDIEFDYWAHSENLSPQEKFLIETYLDKNGKTLEAGTAGGRILFGMQNLGFTSLYGFDYVAEFIEEARKKDTTGSICFSVEDATALNYKDCEFDQLVYLEQIISSIEDEIGRLNAFKEAYRILRKGGTAIFSFLNFHDRVKNPFYNLYLRYIKLLRIIYKSQQTIQYIPRLKLCGKPNLNALLDQQPYMYWYKVEEIYKLATEVNFEIVALGSGFEVNQEILHVSLGTLNQDMLQGMLYLVCKK